MTVCTVAIMCYYSVVSGWTLRYAGLALTGGLAGLGPAAGEPCFLDYTKTWWPALTHVLSMGICCGVVALGVTGGIERVCKVLVPALFVVLVVCAVQGLSLDGSEDGLAFLTTFDNNPATACIGIDRADDTLQFAAARSGRDVDIARPGLDQVNTTTAGVGTE